jgi:hypothetical protein
MSMEHKAFVFNLSAFESELLPILYRSLERSDNGELFQFIDQNRESLVDPYEGEPLSGDWRSLLETEDAHQLGDFALTKYYDPLEDIGVGHAWLSMSESVRNLLLGRPVGPEANYFDPGKMGSYFQSADEVRESRASLRNVRDPDLSVAMQMFDLALADPKGLYVTF